MLLDIITRDHVSVKTPCYVTQLNTDPLVLGLPWLREHKVVIDCANDCLVFNAPSCFQQCMSKKTVVPCIPKEEVKRSESLMDIRMIGPAPLAHLARRPGHQVFVASMKDIEKALAPKEEIDVMSKLPSEYHEFASLFSREEADKLPPHRPYDHKIPLKPGVEPPFGPLYSMSRDELVVLKKYLDENLAKGFIRASSSPAASPVIFVKKPGGGLRLCVDYRGLNALTTKNRYPLPLIRETLNLLASSTVFTKLDVIAAFNKLRMAEGEEWKTAMRTRYGLFESLVMPFGLSGSPSTWQRFINDTLREYLDVFCTAYVDDILIFSKNKKEHKDHVRKVLTKLREAGLQLDISKCEFHVTTVKFLGLIITNGGIHMDPAKVAAILEWKVPKTVKDIQSFLGFANFYRRFIRHFSKIVSPLTKLTRKGVKFNWNSKAQDAFDELKKAFTTAPILIMFDPEKPCVVETDSSDEVTGGVLSQKDDDGILRPVAYLSSRLSPTECNYDIYDKELLAITRAFEEWRAELEGAAHTIGVISDHKNLEYFMTTKQLSRRQARWSEFLSRFDFQIQYRPGKQNNRADALTRRSADLSKDPTDPRRTQQQQVVIKPQNLSSELKNHMEFKWTKVSRKISLQPVTVQIPSVETPAVDWTETETPAHNDPEPEPNDEPTIQDELQDSIAKAYATDPRTQEIIRALDSGARTLKNFPLSECTLRKGRIYYRERLYIPEVDELRLRIFRLCHDSALAGHPGKAKLMELVARTYWWPEWSKHSAQYTRNCHACRRAKPSRLRYQGALRPLPVPERRWTDITVDFIEGLPPSPNLDGVLCTNILVVVDRLSKQAHYVACKGTTAKDTANMFYHYIFKYHGLPSSITSDRGTQFVNHFWKTFCHILGINTRLSTAFHPQTDGQTERTNATLEAYLRIYVDYLQNDWARWLPSAEFSFNNLVSEATNCTPFFANSGQHPRLGVEPFTVDNTLRDSIQAQQQVALDFGTKMETINETLREQMTRAQTYYEEFANRNRDYAPILKVGDMVWLDTRNMSSQQPSKKLGNKSEGPFKVSKIISPHATELEIPESWGHHNVFGNYLIRCAANDPLPGQVPPPPLPNISTSGVEEFEVDSILDSRIHRGMLEFLVRWIGYPMPTWQPFEDVKHAAVAMDDYFEKHPGRAGQETWRHYNPEEDSDSEYEE